MGEFLYEEGISANDVSTVVWGSPCTDSTGGGYARVPDHILTDAEAHEQREHGYLASDTAKGAIFRHLQEYFPYAVVIVTAVWCNPTPPRANATNHR